MLPRAHTGRVIELCCKWLIIGNFTYNKTKDTLDDEIKTLTLLRGKVAFRLMEAKGDKGPNYRITLDGVHGSRSRLCQDPLLLSLQKLTRRRQKSFGGVQWYSMTCVGDGNET